MSNASIHISIHSKTTKKRELKGMCVCRRIGLVFYLYFSGREKLFLKGRG